MRLERLEKYRTELAQSASRTWGAILLRLASEAMGSEKSDAGVAEHELRKEVELLRIKLALALGALDSYAHGPKYNDDNDGIALLAITTLEKISKVDWLTAKGTSGEPPAPR